MAERECRFHPGRPGYVQCQKMEYWYCRECLADCLACTDPCEYCRHRPSCIIWELCRQEARKRCQEMKTGQTAAATETGLTSKQD